MPRNYELKGALQVGRGRKRLDRALDEGRAKIARRLAEAGEMTLSEALSLIAGAIIEGERTANGKRKKLKSIKERLSKALRRVILREQQSGKLEL